MIEPRPDRMINKDGYTVRYHAPHPTTPAIRRFLAMIDLIGDCHIFRGSFRFRVDDGRVISPQRYVLEEIGEITVQDRCRIVSTCHTPNCCRPTHMEWRILGRKQE